MMMTNEYIRLLLFIKYLDHKPDLPSLSLSLRLDYTSTCSNDTSSSRWSSSDTLPSHAITPARVV